MGYKVSFTAAAEHDFDLIAGFLIETHLSFGETGKRAAELAEKRVLAIRKSAESLARTPFRGTLHSDMSPNLRHVTVNRADFWFEVIDRLEEVRVLAVFFGGQDHTRRMLVRLLEGKQ